MPGTGSYFDKALTDTNRNLVGTMRKQLREVDYDTIIGTGLSGTIFAARVAPTLGKKFAIVRKKDDHSTHSGNQVEGLVGLRWVFADDFVSMGGTLKRVLNMMKKHFPASEFVGVYQYEDPSFSDPDESAYRWGNWVTELSIGCLYGPKTLAQVKQESPWDTGPLKVPLSGWDRRVRPLIPISDRSELSVDYQDAYGRPGVYDNATRTSWSCEDEKAIPYIEEVERAAKDSGYSIAALVGTRLDRLPGSRFIRLYRNPVPVKTLEDFTDSVIAADEAIAAMRTACSNDSKIEKGN